MTSMNQLVKISRPLGRMFQQRSMYDNPYVTRFKQKSKVSPNHFKQSTGLTGLFVVEYPHRSLKIIYGRILRTLEKMPATSIYRISTENIIKNRLALVEEEADIQKLEAKIGMGQIEEVIQQGELELQAARAVLESKAWEPLPEKPAPEQWRWPVV